MLIFSIISTLLCSKPTSISIVPSNNSISKFLLPLRYSYYIYLLLVVPTISIQSSLLHLLFKIGWYNITSHELRSYLSLMGHHGSLDTCDEGLFPVNILETLIEMSRRENIPSYFAEFGKNTLGFIEISSLGERVWPPPRGYCISFWFCYDSLFPGTTTTATQQVDGILSSSTISIMNLFCFMLFILLDPALQFYYNSSFYLLILI